MLRVAWGAGDLRYKLHPGQREIWDNILASHKTVDSSMDRVYALDISRQWGKDYLMCAFAVGVALRRRRPTRLPYAAPTKDMLKEIIVPTMVEIFEDCPPELRPIEIQKGTFTRSADTLTWPKWGSRIVMVGVDVHPDRLRGPATYAFFFTECAFAMNLTDLMDGILMPQLLTIPDGFGIMASTPPVTPAHPWTTRFIPECKTRGMYAKRVITDNPRLSERQIKAAVKALGGPDSTRVRRELYCEHIVETSAVVIPEFDEQVNVIDDYVMPAPHFRDCFTVLDPGMVNASGALFGYYDFEHDKLVIEGDFAKIGQNTRPLARLVKAREWQLWGVRPEKPKAMDEATWSQELTLMRQEFYPNILPPETTVTSYNAMLRPAPFARYSDTELRLIADLSLEHGLVFGPAAKDDLEAAINMLRIRIQEGKIVFRRRCVNAINHVQNALWNKQRTKFMESPDGTHFDCLAALVYLNRMIPWGRNPVPPTTYSRHTHFIPRSKPNAWDSTAHALSSIFRKGK